MATPHNEAKKGDIAKIVLMPGDPLRAKFVADNFLEDVVQFNSVRNMFGYTGSYKGKRISVMGSGMGMPSIGIYAHELYSQYDVEAIIRIGSCGAYVKDIHVNDIILAIGSSTDSNFAHHYQLPGTYSATATFELLDIANKKAKEQGCNYKVGNILSSDVFYSKNSPVEKWAQMGVLAVEMESYALYTIAAELKKSALCILTVSDSLVLDENLSPMERQTGFTNMMEIALKTAYEYI